MKKHNYKNHFGLVLPIILIATCMSACGSLPPFDSFPIKEPPAKDNSSEDDRIEIFKNERILNLYLDGELSGTFTIALGHSPAGDKDKQGDKRTPTGKYYICTRNDKSRFTLFLGLSYPNTNDAKRGLDRGLIDQATYNTIADAEKSNIRPPWNTPLGGEIGIHGGGTSSDWTLGCIALSDEDIRTLWEKTKLKMPVYIYEKNNS